MNINVKLIRVSLLIFGILLADKSQAEQTHIAVATNFSLPMKAIVKAFEEESGHSIRLIFGSSGKLFSQINNNAPFDVFLSADTTKPNVLIHTKIAVADSLFTYAIGALVLWGPRSNINTQLLLTSGHYKKLAIANPRLAPYGAASIEVLEQLGLSSMTTPKLVMGENIAQAYQFVSSGNAQIGFVAKSQLIENGLLPAGTWLVPDELHSAIHQNAVLLKRGQNNVAAISLLAFLRSETAKNIIHQHGYTTIE